LDQTAADKTSGDATARILRDEIARHGMVDPNSVWTPYHGGRTNRIWKIDHGGGALVCKLFDPTGGTLLFPNDIAAESKALAALAGSTIAPELIAKLAASLGDCLIYAHIAGTIWQGDLVGVAATLARLHATRPVPEFRQIDQGADGIRDIGLAILADCSTTARAELIARLPADAPPTAPISPVFLHGDLVPGNIICNDQSITFIDWQCPAIGDPCEDIATFLSPAMQTLYGHRQLSPPEVDAFLMAYAKPSIAQRYRDLRAMFHWRMAAHCAWKAERGFIDYHAAARLELDALQQV
jgi:thiamine kinase